MPSHNQPPDQTRLRADAEEAEIFSQMALTRLREAKASRDALAAQWKCRYANGRFAHGLEGLPGSGSGRGAPC